MYLPHLRQPWICFQKTFNSKTYCTCWLNMCPAAVFKQCQKSMKIRYTPCWVLSISARFHLNIPPSNEIKWGYTGVSRLSVGLGGWSVGEMLCLKQSSSHIFLVTVSKRNLLHMLPIVCRWLMCMTQVLWVPTSRFQKMRIMRHFWNSYISLFAVTKRGYHRVYNHHNQ